ncbi:uncharacterized protein LOC133420934 [Cololabis saira]|uniref:uncharacterized protein LOC133420934 n=1 Tax=Cololabis saira TaxID=129043 RepID=UPI002AD226D2|nr:uncharacterized protein LOC133420934 [Cololabis saira]
MTMRDEGVVVDDHQLSRLSISHSCCGREINHELVFAASSGQSRNCSESEFLMRPDPENVENHPETLEEEPGILHPTSSHLGGGTSVFFSSVCRLSGCHLSEDICPLLSSVLSSQSSSLTELDLSNNDLQDSGLEQLCPGLESPHCHLECLRLSGCLISEEGSSSLVSALTSNPSHLRELDLSYNHPGESAGELLSRVEDPRWRLDTLRVEPAGQRWLTPGLRKYSCRLTVDTNTVHRRIKLSDDNRKMMLVGEDQSYPDHPDRFDQYLQLLCGEVLTGRCYWEVQWSGAVCVSVSYRRVSRKGTSDDCEFGRNDHSWRLDSSPGHRYRVLHNKRETFITSSSPCPDSGRAAVYVDVPAGTLSFYEVSDRLIHLHTFNTSFSEPLCAGFTVCWSSSDSSVSLCPV